MGILNVTPDSFYDGGRLATADDAVQAGLTMRDEGADLVDVGGESTRPGSAPVAYEEEARRTLAVVERLAKEGIRVSIDTSKPAIAREALARGASFVNDVTGLRDPQMRRVCAEARCEVCIMHMQGEPATMQSGPVYGDVVSEVREALLQAAKAAEEDGVDGRRIWLDPGIGFGKTTRHNLELIRGLGALVELGYPVLVGASRKAFIGRILGAETKPLGVEDRGEGTLAAHVLAQAAGASMVRVHDVVAARRAIDVAHAILTA